MTCKKIVKGIEKEIIAFADLRGLRRFYNESEDRIYFYDKDDREVVFVDSNDKNTKSAFENSDSKNLAIREFVLDSDYAGLEKKGLSPIPSTENGICIGAIRNGFSNRMDKVDLMFNLIIAYSKYGFNLSHSIAYAVISYKSAYLSYYYPIEFYCSILRNYKASTDDKLKNAIITAKKRKIEIMPPCVNTSLVGYEVLYDENDKACGIIAGLSNIAFVGIDASKAIINEREENGEYTSFMNFIERLIDDFDKSNGKNPITKTHINGLILGGAFDELEQNRFALYKFYNLEENKMPKKAVAKYHIATVDEIDDIDKAVINRRIVEELKEEEYSRIYKIILEEKFLRASVSEHPLSAVDEKYLVDFDDYTNEEKIEIAGFLVSSEKKKTSTGKKYGIYKIETASSQIVECKIWDIEKPSVKRKIPSMISKHFFLEDKGKEDLKKILDKLEKESKKKPLSVKKAEDYITAYYNYKKKDLFGETRNFTPYIFKGKVSEWNGNFHIILNEIIPIENDLSKLDDENKNTNDNSFVDIEFDDIF